MDRQTEGLASAIFKKLKGEIIEVRVSTANKILGQG